MTATILIVIFAAPLLWSAAIAGLRRLSPADDQPDDKSEKRYLMILLAPVVLGPLAAIVARWLPLPVALTTPATVVVATGLAEGQGPSIWPLLAPWLIYGCMSLYAAGLAVKAVPLTRQFLTLHRIVRRAEPSAIAPEVRLTDAAVPPLSWARGIVLLPHSLITRLSTIQLDLLIAHERAHIARGDVAWYAALSWIDAIFWFNPFVRHQTVRCRLAAELACDAAVTRAAPTMREAYAACLLTTLKHVAGDALQCAPAIFSPSNSGEFKMRMTEIMRNSTASRKPRWLVQALAALLVLPLVGVQYAWSQDNAAKPAGDGAVNCPHSQCQLAADRWEVDNATGVTTLSGHVQVKQDGRTYNADSARIDRKSGEMTLSGAAIVIDAPSAKTRPAPSTSELMSLQVPQTADIRVATAEGRPDVILVAGNTENITGRPAPTAQADSIAVEKGTPQSRTTITVTGRRIVNGQGEATRETTTDTTIQVVGHPTLSRRTITVTGRPLKPSDTAETIKPAKPD